MSQLVLDKLSERFGAAILETHSNFGDDTAVVDPASWKAVCTFLRDDPALDFDMPVDLCGVDYPSRGATAHRGRDAPLFDLAEAPHPPQGARRRRGHGRRRARQRRRRSGRA